MGIKSLLPYLKQYCKEVNLRDFAGQTAAIDASCWIHRALAISVSQSGNRDRLATIFQKNLDLLKRAEVTPFMVFDGMPLPAKANQAAKRQRVRDEALRKASAADMQEERYKLLSQGISISFQDISICIDICLNQNIRYIVSPYESDAQIAFLLQHGHADIAISEDSELLAYGCKDVLMKMKLSGDCDHFVLDNILDGLRFTHEQFQKMCIVAGCDYLDNIKGVGIHRAFALVSTNNLFGDLAKKGAPEDYEKHFEKAIAVFNHQTVFDITSMKCVPLTDWGREISNELQLFCGKLLDNTISLNLASGNVDPRSGMKVNSHPILQKVVNTTNHECYCSGETATTSKENERLAVSIIKVHPTPFSYRIPLFPVITVDLKKVSYCHEGKEYEGLIKAEGPLNIGIGKYICTSSCHITIDKQSYLVLWELNKDTTETHVSTDDVLLPGEQQGLHCLPFKVLGSCYKVSRQRALEEAYEYLNDYNRPVFSKLEPEPENDHDKNAIGVHIMTGEDYVRAGYIAGELTKYLHPLMATSELDVSVKHVRFCTTYLRMGFYLTIEITKRGMWAEEVVKASRKVA